MCVFMYFWLEYYLGLSLFLSLIGLRLLILLNAAARDMRLAAIHLRNKFALRAEYIFDFLAPMFAFVLYVTMNKGAKMTTYHNVDVNSSSQTSYIDISVRSDSAVDIGSDGASAMMIDAINASESIDVQQHLRAMCETETQYKVLLIAILTMYGVISAWWAYRLGKTDIDMGYASATIHIVIVSVIVMTTCTILHMVHALTYAGGRFVFVFCILFLHLFSYWRIVLPGLPTHFQISVPLPFSGNRTNVDQEIGSVVSSLRSKPMKHPGHRAMGTINPTVLNENKKLAESFYKFAIANGKNLECCFQFGSFSRKGDFGSGVEYEDSDVEAIVDCIHELNSLITLFKDLPDPELQPLPVLSDSPAVKRSTSSIGDLKLENRTIDFSNYNTGDLPSISRTAKYIIETFFRRESKKKRARLDMLKREEVKRFTQCWQMASPDQWDSESVYTLRDSLQLFLTIQFGPLFSSKEASQCIHNTMSESYKTLQALLDDGIITKKYLMDIYRNLEGEEAYLMLFPQDIDVDQVYDMYNCGSVEEANIRNVIQLGIRKRKGQKHDSNNNFENDDDILGDKRDDFFLHDDPEESYNRDPLLLLLMGGAPPEYNVRYAYADVPGGELKEIDEPMLLFDSDSEASVYDTGSGETARPSIMPKRVTTFEKLAKGEFWRSTSGYEHMTEEEEIEARMRTITGGRDEELADDENGVPRSYRQVVTEMVRRKREYGYHKPKPIPLEGGGYEYPTVSWAFTEFFYHFWLWLSMRPCEWASVQYAVKVMRKKPWGREFLNSPCACEFLFVASSIIEASGETVEDDILFRDVDGYDKRVSYITNAPQHASMTVNKKANVGETHGINNSSVPVDISFEDEDKLFDPTSSDDLGDLL